MGSGILEIVFVVDEAGGYGQGSRESRMSPGFTPRVFAPANELC